MTVCTSTMDVTGLVTTDPCPDCGHVFLQHVVVGSRLKRCVICEVEEALAELKAAKQ